MNGRREPWKPAREDLGFRYTISWVEGVKRAVSWLEQYQKNGIADDSLIDDRIIAAWSQIEADIHDKVRW